MTSDAKIGLLLGLVFIFIIAFVINGLPRFQPDASDNNEQAAEEIFIQPNPIGYNERNAIAEEQYVQDEFSDPTVNEEVEPEFTINNNPWANDHATVQDNYTDNYYNQYYYPQESEQTTNYSSLPLDEITEYEEDTTVTMDDSQDNVRLFMDFPTSVFTTTEVPIEGSNNRNINSTDELTSVSTGLSINEGFRTVGRTQSNTRRQQGGFAQTESQNQEITGNGSTLSRQNPVADDTLQTRVNSQAQTFKQKSYIVQEGDNNLAKIAKKFYGEQEGNRLVNINRIYEVNKNVLKSPDKIFIGQTLVIPQPAPPVEPQPSDVLKGSMFQPVTSVGGTTAKQDTAESAPGRWYVVKEDDNLWKIAAEQLGKGTRYGEISKLNAKRLSDENKLKPGMKLLLPDE